MRSLRFLSFAVLCAAVLAVAAAQASAQVALPGSVAGWTKNAEPQDVPAADLEPVWHEYGLVSRDLAVFRRGSDSFSAMVYKVKDASGAYGLYSYLQQPEMRPANFTDHSAISNDRALVLIGNFVLDVQIHGPAAEGRTIDALVAAISAKAETGALPILGSYLPTQHQVGYSDRYAEGPQTLDHVFPGGLGNSVGFNHSAEAEVAQYRIAGRDET